MEPVGRQDVLLQAVAAFFREPQQGLSMETTISSLTSEAGDWHDLGCALEERFGLDLDMSEWGELGGNPGGEYPISPEVTIEAVWKFLQDQPELTIERRVKKVIAGARNFVDPDCVPDCYRFEGTAMQWMDLRVSIERALHSLGVRLDSERWKELGRRCAPIVQQIVKFVSEACATSVA